jgi:hypothetical protein
VAIPLSNTTITVLRIKDPDLYDEPYAGSGEADRDEVAAGVRAVIDNPAGRVDLEGGQQNVADYGLKCDPIDTGLRYLDWVKDARSGRTFIVVWLIDFGDHIEAQMRDTEGEV